MKRYLLLWITPFFFLHWTLSANAETAGEVSGWCREYDNVDAAGGARFTQPDSRTNHYCWGAFAAVQDLIVAESRDGTRLLGACVVQQTTRLEMIHIFRRYMVQHPEREQLGFGQGVVLALTEAYPCEN